MFTTILFILLGIALLITAGYLIGGKCLFFMLHDDLAFNLAIVLTGCGVLSIAHALALLTIL